MKKSNLNKIKIGFVICFVILIVLIIIVMRNTNKANKVKNIGSVTTEISEKSVAIQNFDDILSMLPLPSGDMHAKVQDFTLEFIKEAYYSLNQEDYYKTNQNKISRFLYNSSLEEFEKLSEQLNKLSSEKLKLEEIIFEKEIYEEEDGKYSFEMQVKYENENYLTYIVHVNKNTNNVNEKILFEPN